MESAVFEIVTFRPEHQPQFEKLNRDWIEKYFTMEPIDHAVLSNPKQHILDSGGSIFMASIRNETVGTVALKKSGPGIFELTKMAVDEKFQGRKIGHALAEEAIRWAKNAGAERVILYSSRKLLTALSLYRKLGFEEVPVDGPYQRSDIKMELKLTSP